MVNRPLIFKVLKAIFLSLFIIAITLNSSCSCGIIGKPPDRSVINPVVISDGVGGNIIAFQRNMGDGAVTYVRRIDADGTNIWVQDIRLDPSQPYKPYVASPTELIGDRKGNYFVVWGFGDYIWIKKYDINGNSVWKSKVKAGKCHELYKLKAISDDAGGVIIGCYNQKGDFWLQEINGDGKPMWSPAKRLSNVVGFDISTDSSGDILLFYVNFVYVTFERSFYLRKLDLSEKNLWNSPVLLATHKPEISNKVKPVDSSELDYNTTTVSPHRPSSGEYSIWLFSNMDGSCMAGYSNIYADTYPDTSLNIYKINNEGSISWSKSLPSTEEQSTVVLDFATSRIVSDSSGGIFIICKVMAENPDASVIVKHIDSSGNEVFNATDSVEVTDNVWNYYEAQCRAVADGSGGIVVTWHSATRDNNNVEIGSILRAQKLDLNGEKQWGSTGIILPYSLQTGSRNVMFSITSDGSNGFVVNLGLIIWRIAPDGKLLWESRLGGPIK